MSPERAGVWQGDAMRGHEATSPRSWCEGLRRFARGIWEVAAEAARLRVQRRLRHPGETRCGCATCPAESFWFSFG